MVGFLPIHIKNIALVMSLAGERKSVAWCRSTELFHAVLAAPTAGRALWAHGGKGSPPIEPAALSEASLSADRCPFACVLQGTVEDSRDGVLHPIDTR